MKDRILELLDEGLMHWRKHHDKGRDEKAIHPSAIGNCLRRNYYTMTGAECQPLSPKVYRIFDNGHSAHTRLANYFRRAGVLIAEEQPLRHEALNIKGSADAIIDIDGERILIDFKTIKNYPFDLMKKGSKELDKTYRYQINTYMWLLGLKKSFFVFENKNTQDLHVEPCEYDEEIIDDIKDRIERLHKCIEDKAPPEKEYEPSNWHCEYCSFNKLCYGPDYKGKR